MRTLSAKSFIRSALVAITVGSAMIMAGTSTSSANSKYSGIVIDAKTGKTLYSYKADKLRYPASLTKMMTMYMMFDALESGKLTKKTRIRMSKFAASKPPSKLGIKPGGTIAAEHAILALATKSANDVAAAVAEHLGGSEAGFARMMTRKARQLGMKSTTFKNASGLTAKGQLTTARDMARLGVALREHFPQYYKYFSTRNFKYGKANYRNHNRLLGQVKGVDGIKTGYTRASGFNLVSSVEANRRSIVAVVLGGRSGKSRNAQMAKLIRQYLSKASRGKKRKTLIAGRSRTVYVASASNLQLPKRGPMPTARPTIDVTKPVQVASAAIPSAKVASVAQSDLNKVDNRSTASVPQTGKPTDWIIQIAAAGSRAGAINLMNDARKKASSVLSSRDGYTESTKKNGVTLHRARFSGFTGKKDARNTCKVLKQQNISCLALTSG